jgi:DNA-binding transcriptional regulator YiaG
MNKMHYYGAVIIFDSVLNGDAMPKPTHRFLGTNSSPEDSAPTNAIQAEVSGKEPRRSKGAARTPLSPAEIKAIRKALKVSQARFADMVGVSAHSVTAWERGVRRPDGVTSRLIRLLGRDPGFIQTWRSL